VTSADAPPGAVQPSATDPVAPLRGGDLKVYLLTMGQGDALWERFGHNALVIRDMRTGVGTAWNWGVFDFAAPDFLQRFLTGDTRYWMAGDDFAQTLDRYRWMNRSLWLQELALPDDAKLALAQQVTALSFSEDRFYRYDYFRDNCSTRVRDALDRATNGAVRASLTQAEAGTTFRRETERLLAGMPAAAIGVDVALGARADRPLSQWEASFVPMTLRDAVRAVRVPDGAGGTKPLVVRDDALFVASRVPEAVMPPPVSLWTAPSGVALACLLGVLIQAMPRSSPARVAIAGLAAAWGLVCGVVGVVLLLAATVTRHDFWGANANLLAYSPLSCALVVLVPAALVARKWERLARGVALGVVLSGTAAGIAALATGQPLAATLGLAMPVHAMVYLALRRGTARA
jgi:hypothetical protein